jgi:hypothetical protein
MLATNSPNVGKRGWMRRLLVEEDARCLNTTTSEIERRLVAQDIAERLQREKVFGFESNKRNAHLAQHTNTNMQDGYCRVFDEFPPGFTNGPQESMKQCLSQQELCHNREESMKQLLAQHEARDTHTQWQMTQIYDALSGDLLQHNPSSDADLSPTTKENVISNWGDEMDPHRELEEVD